MAARPKPMDPAARRVAVRIVSLAQPHAHGCGCGNPGVDRLCQVFRRAFVDAIAKAITAARTGASRG